MNLDDRSAKIKTADKMSGKMNDLKEAAIEKIIELAARNNGFIRTRDLLVERISKTHLATMVKLGHLGRVKQGLYRLADLETVGYEYFIDAQKAIPQGVICFLSALKYYELTTINPSDIYMAIPRKAKAVLPEYPPVKIYYLGAKCFQIEIGQIVIRGETVKIYTREKTLCDCITYRDKIGADQTIEAFKTYLQDKSLRNLPLLLNIAERCGVSETVRNYTEVLV